MRPHATAVTALERNDRLGPVETACVPNYLVRSTLCLSHDHVLLGALGHRQNLLGTIIVIPV